MERSADDVIALMADVLEGHSATAKSQQELITIASLASQFMLRLTPSSEQERGRMGQPSTSQTNPVSSAGISSSDPGFGSSFIDQALTDLFEVLRKKNSDYKVTTSEFSNFHYAGDIAGISTRDVMLAQIGIKLGRLRGLTQSGKDPEWESVEDTAKDLAGYAVILYAYYLEMNS